MVSRHARKDENGQSHHWRRGFYFFCLLVRESIAPRAVPRAGEMKPRTHLACSDDFTMTAFVASSMIPYFFPTYVSRVTKLVTDARLKVFDWIIDESVSIEHVIFG
jgi:hypothetical protein